MPAKPTNPAQPSAHLDADLEQDLALLREIAEIGTDLARILHRQVQAKAKPADREDPSAAFERIARAVRRTIHLRQHLRQNSLARTTQRTATRAQIIRQVENTIDRETRDPATAESLKVELLERLETPEFEHDIQTRPTADIVAETLSDLGLRHLPGTPRERRTTDTLRTLYAQAAKPPPTKPQSNPPATSLLEHLLRER